MNTLVINKKRICQSFAYLLNYYSLEHPIVRLGTPYRFLIGNVSVYLGDRAASVGAVDFKQSFYNHVVFLVKRTNNEE